MTCQGLLGSSGWPAVAVSKSADCSAVVGSVGSFTGSASVAAEPAPPSFGAGAGGGGLAGQQFLPVQLTIGFACGPGFQLLATNLADGDLLLGQVYAGFADIQAFQAQQWFVRRVLDGKAADAELGVAQQ